MWDRAYLNLGGPATITITDHGHGEIAFGALQAELDLEHSRSSIGFTWQGFDEMDEVSGDGPAELLDDGAIQIEFTYHNVDEAVFKAQRVTLVEPHRRQPAAVSLGSPLFCRRQCAHAGGETLQMLPRLAQYPHRRRARPDQVAHRLMDVIENRHRRQFAGFFDVIGAVKKIADLPPRSPRADAAAIFSYGHPVRQKRYCSQARPACLRLGAVQPGAILD